MLLNPGNHPLGVALFGLAFLACGVFCAWAMRSGKMPGAPLSPAKKALLIVFFPVAFSCSGLYIIGEAISAELAPQHSAQVHVMKLWTQTQGSGSRTTVQYLMRDDHGRTYGTMSKPVWSILREGATYRCVLRGPHGLYRQTAVLSCAPR